MIKNLPLKNIISKILNKVGLLTIKHIPDVNNISFGSFFIGEPFSRRFGYDRGGPIDRYYIEEFLSANESEIKGDILEIGDNEYSLKYGKKDINQSFILHYAEGNDKSDFVGDLSKIETLPQKKFDCIIITQTLQYIYDYKSAIKNAYSLLKNNGTLLITVPGISPIDQGELKDNWLWSFTKNAISNVIYDILPNKDSEIGAFGNVHTATCFLYGVGLTEVNNHLLNIRDEAYDVIITAKIKKS